jgi:hypothetical protein
VSVAGAAIVAEAQKFLGDRYVYATQGPTTFDCSGLVQYVYKQLGIALPRTSEEQYAALPPVSAADAQPGDLVFFGGSGPGYYYDGTPSSPGHVGIYIGNGQMINALNPTAGVLVTSTAGAVGYRRPAGVSGSATDASLPIPLPGGGIITVPGIGGSGGLFSIPDEIVSFFSDFDQYVTDAYKTAKLFFMPSTYVRIGAGIAGTGFVIAGLLLLMREAKT